MEGIEHFRVVQVRSHIPVSEAGSNFTVHYQKTLICTHAPPSEVGRLMSASVVGVVEARLMVALLFSSSASDPVCLKCDISSPSLTM